MKIIPVDEVVSLETFCANVGTEVEVHEKPSGGWVAVFNPAVLLAGSGLLEMPVIGWGATVETAIKNLASDLSGRVVVRNGLYAPRRWWQTRELQEIDLRKTRVVAQ